MELNDVILGFLDWKQMTGYELKGLFEKMDFLPWSGNNNQIYKSLLELEKEGLVEKEVVQQESFPAQKRYRATEAGRRRLNAAVKTLPEETAVRSDFLPASDVVERPFKRRIAFIDSGLPIKGGNAFSYEP